MIGTKRKSQGHQQVLIPWLRFKRSLYSSASFVAPLSEGSFVLLEPATSDPDHYTIIMSKSKEQIGWLVRTIKPDLFVEGFSGQSRLVGILHQDPTLHPLLGELQLLWTL